VYVQGDDAHACCLGVSTQPGSPFELCRRASARCVLSACVRMCVFGVCVRSLQLACFEVLSHSCVHDELNMPKRVPRRELIDTTCKRRHEDHPTQIALRCFTIIHNRCACSRAARVAVCKQHCALPLLKPRTNVYIHAHNTSVRAMCVHSSLQLCWQQPKFKASLVHTKCSRELQLQLICMCCAATATTAISTCRWL
jgi:hypothetical protein